jgi:hypothetical protein
MSASVYSPLALGLAWLVRQAAPACPRFPVGVELLLLAGWVGDEDTVRTGRRVGVAGQALPSDNAQRASQRALAESRRRVHHKCDNSAKV